MTHAIWGNIAKLRIVVGILGEKNRFGWWKSDFYSPGSDSFLNPIFGKTAFLARYHGVRESAALVHDEHIGIGEGVFHLFRLPERMERKLHEWICNNGNMAEMNGFIQAPDSSEQFIRNFSEQQDAASIGPVLLGNADAIEQPAGWKVAACHYDGAFRNQTMAFPYFSAKG